jgi:hypothetical protein
MSLDAAKVRAIRTSGLTDAHYARIYKVSVRTIRNARTGLTWATHPTPPDRAPREGAGRKASIHARPAPKAVLSFHKHSSSGAFMRPVRWQYRDGRDGEWCRHYRGGYVVTCQDMDGDGTEWGVGLKVDYEKPLPKDPTEWIRDWRIAHGFVGMGSDFEIAKVVAIAALEAIIRDREECEAERRVKPENSPSDSTGCNP